MWDPFKDLDNIMKQLASARTGFTGGDFFSSSSKGSWLPLVDIAESDKSYTVTVDLPGVRKEDMEVTMEENQLCISGTRALPEGFATAADNKPPKQWFVMGERGYGRFERCFKLPHKIAEESLRAKFDGGVLDVTMDKKDPQNTRQGGNRVNIN